MRSNDQPQLTRRGFFGAMGAAGLGVTTLGGTLSGLMQEAHADPMDDLIKQELGEGAVAMEKVKINAPDTAENAALVRLPIVVDHPMEPNNYIQSMIVIADNNPKPLVAKLDLLPELGVVDMEFRIRMAKKGPVRVIVKTNTGKLYGAVKEINVAEGGCAG